MKGQIKTPTDQGNSKNNTLKIREGSNERIFRETILKMDGETKPMIVTETRLKGGMINMRENTKIRGSEGMEMIEKRAEKERSQQID